MSAGLIKFSCRFFDRLKVAHKFHSTQPKKTSSQTGEVFITDETEPDFISNGPESLLLRDFNLKLVK